MLKTETQKSLADRSIARLTVNCPLCSTSNEIKGIFRDATKDISGIVCVNNECGQHLPEKFLSNRVTLFLRELLEVYYAGKSSNPLIKFYKAINGDRTSNLNPFFLLIGNYKCGEPSCKTLTQQLSVNQRCVNGTCKGRLDGQVNEGKTNDTLRYLQGLFDVPKYI